MEYWNKYQKKWNEIYRGAKVSLADSLARYYGNMTIHDTRNFQKLPREYNDAVLIIAIPRFRSNSYLMKLPASYSAIPGLKSIHLNRYWYSHELLGEEIMITEAAYNKYEDVIYYKEWKFVTGIRRNYGIKRS